MAAYRPSLPYESPPLRRRVSGFGLALAVNLLLLFVLLGIGKFAPDVRKNSTALIVDLLPESHSVSQQQRTKSVQHPNVEHRPVLKPPRIVLPHRPGHRPGRLGAPGREGAEGPPLRPPDLEEL